MNKSILHKEEIKSNMIKATKWSTITEISTKLITPITNMILARILAPEAFGVVATVTIIFSFADILTDAGFEKFLIQHEFEDENEKYKYANVAFWTNLGISLVLWGIITLFCEPIATFVGNPGLGKVIAIACVQLILTSFSCIQTALYRRNFDFKTLFLMRIVVALSPFLITIPLAIIGLNYWALIIGSIFGQLINSIILTVKSKWKPKIFYDANILKKMFSFSSWSLIESISIWLTTWADSMIIANTFNSYYLGLYKTSITMINSLFSVITASTTTVLFSALSRLQSENSEFKNIFLKTQRYVSILVFPLGIGIFLFRNLATQLFLGDKWTGANQIIGIWALASTFSIVFCYYCSEVYRAKGRPRLSFFVQIIYFLFLLPTCIISSKYGFLPFVYARAACVLFFIVIHVLAIKYLIGLNFVLLIKNVYQPLLSSSAMGIFGYFLLRINGNIVWSFISILICILFYFGVLFLFPQMRMDFIKMVRRVQFKKSQKTLLNKNITINSEY